MNHVYRDATEALPHLLHRVMDMGHDTDSRNGKCREIMMQQVTLTNPFPFEITTTGRNGSLPAQIAETMWILAGRDDVDWLSNYLPRAKDYSDDGKTWHGAYGPRLRKWAPDENGWGTDQLAHVVDLLKDDPTTRRAVMQIYNPSEDSFSADVKRKDIPCNNWIHFLPRDGKLYAHVAIRSNDLMWGWSGINHFEWAAIQHIVAGLVGMEQGALTFSISSLHLYEPHWDKAKSILNSWDVEEERGKRFTVANDTFDPAAAGHSVSGLDALVGQWFEVEALIRSNGPSKQVEYTIGRFPDAMMRGWLRVLYSWWHGVTPGPGYGTNSSLGYALAHSPKRKVASVILPPVEPGSFTEFVSVLHEEKHAVYGDSWMKRGEMLGIMANLARKVDRLGVGGAGDTAADTAIDLLCYSMKYRLWLCAYAGAPLPAPFTVVGAFGGSAKAPVYGHEHSSAVTDMLRYWATCQVPMYTNDHLIELIRTKFDSMENLVTEKRVDRYKYVDEFLVLAYPLAERLWLAEQLSEKFPVLEVAEEPVVHGIESVVERFQHNLTRSWNPEA